MWTFDFFCFFKTWKRRFFVRQFAGVVLAVLSVDWQAGRVVWDLVRSTEQLQRLLMRWMMLLCSSVCLSVCLSVCYLLTLLYSTRSTYSIVDVLLPSSSSSSLLLSSSAYVRYLGAKEIITARQRVRSSARRLIVVPHFKHSVSTGLPPYIVRPSVCVWRLGIVITLRK